MAVIENGWVIDFECGDALTVYIDFPSNIQGILNNTKNCYKNLLLSTFVQSPCALTLFYWTKTRPTEKVEIIYCNCKTELTANYIFKFTFIAISD